MKIEEQLFEDSDGSMESVVNKAIDLLSERDKRIAELEQREKKLEDGWREDEKRYEHRIKDFEKQYKTLFFRLSVENNYAIQCALERDEARLEAFSMSLMVETIYTTALGDRAEIYEFYRRAKSIKEKYGDYQ